MTEGLRFTVSRKDARAALEDNVGRVENRITKLNDRLIHEEKGGNSFVVLQIRAMMQASRREAMLLSRLAKSISQDGPDLVLGLEEARFLFEPVLDVVEFAEQPALPRPSFQA